MADNRKCTICGKEYSYCPRCKHDADRPTWLFAFDTETCMTIYRVCIGYRDKTISIEEAYDAISKLEDLDLDILAEGTRGQIEEILAYKKEEKKENKVENKVEFVKTINNKPTFNKKK